MVKKEVQTRLLNLKREEQTSKIEADCLTMSVNETKAFIGLCRSTQFKWQEQRYSATGGLVPGGEDGMDPQMNNRAQLNMETNTKNTSAYMFNYYILKELMDIDFERTEGEDLPF